jgi:hypothetical protein
LTADRACRRDAAFQGGEHLVRAVEQGLTGQGQLHPVGGALEQLAADDAFQCSDLSAEGRCRDVQPFRGAAEAEPVRHSHECPQVLQVDVGSRREGQHAGSLGLVIGRSGHDLSIPGRRSRRSCETGNSVLRHTTFRLW